MNNLRMLLLVCLLMITALPACNSVTTGQTVEPTKTIHSNFENQFGGQLLFVSNKGEMYKINNNGNNLIKLTNFTTGNVPAWSPDGQRIAFTSNHDGPQEIYLMNSDGAQPTRLTYTNSANMDTPSWSPDGHQLVFAANENDQQNIFLINVNGSNQKQLTSGIQARSPAWSPDGKHIVFAVSGEHHAPSKIAIMDADGSNQKIINENTKAFEYCDGGATCQNDTNPVWSPSGQQVVFLESKENVDICLDSVNGIAQGCLTKDTAVNRSPAWSPDGRYILFESNRNGNYDIYTMDVHGNDIARLTKDKGDNRYPAWSRDGKQIAFVSNRDGNQEIYVMDADGSHLLRLTNNNVDDLFPVWQPQVNP
jgi:Tol biopolymer transport system component